MRKILINLSSVVLFSLPVLTLAAANTSYISDLIKKATSLLSTLLVFLISLSVVWFIWNVTKYSMSSEEDAKAKAKSQMINGIIAIAVSVSVWGLVRLLQRIFGLNEGTSSFTGDLGSMIPGVY